jgi:hypothetical protein
MNTIRPILYDKNTQTINSDRPVSDSIKIASGSFGSADVKEETKPVRKKRQLTTEQLEERREYARAYSARLDIRMRTYIGRANKKGYGFTLTEEQFKDLLSQDCYYCGDPGGTIDRLDSAQGYTIENSKPCCLTCNWMKVQLSHDQFISKAKMIASRFKT